jgi:pSer/pThr/pTyr-binding forkhead associated (FHA) protein
MAYLVFSSAKGEEIGRRRLAPSTPVTIGRSPECDVSLHDILLSRRHCRLVPADGGWVLIDLGSKNGTVVNGQKVTSHPLRDGESFRAGRFVVRFRAGELAPAEERKEKLNRPKRPADPFEAMAGTVAGFKYEPPPDEQASPNDSRAGGARGIEQFPTPRPTMTDSGRFITAEMWAESEAARAAKGGGLPLSPPVMAIQPPAKRRGKSVDDSGISAALDGSVSRASRPKAPEGSNGQPPTLTTLPGPPPRPPRVPMRLRLTPFLRALGKRLRRPFAKRAAVLLACATTWLG